MTVPLELATALQIAPGQCVSLIGGGGKTTSMLALARQLAAGGVRVAVTTTTKMWLPPGLPLRLDSPSPGSIDDRSEPIVAYAAAIGTDDKLVGVPSDRPQELLEKHDVVLVEADGSAGRPLKAHRPWEPVVPPVTDLLLILGGLDALGRPLREAVHRPEVLRCRLSEDEPVTPTVMGLILVASLHHAPDNSRAVILLNKCDLLTPSVAAEVLTAVQSGAPGYPVFLTARGVVAPLMPAPSAEPR